MKIVRKIIEIDEERCDGCGQCVPGCAEGALQIVDGKARIVSDKFCDGLGACIGDCPNDALKIVEREAEEFDEEAVESYLSEIQDTCDTAPAMACGCPSSNIMSFVPENQNEAAKSPSARIPSGLSNWPVQIRLIPPAAPFLKGADLLVMADCVSVAYPGLHRDLINGKVVMMGCPKFDDVDEYIARFTEIFKTAVIRRITIVIMEVPCCSGLPYIVKKALEKSGRRIPMEEIVIGTKGNILSKTEKKAS